MIRAMLLGLALVAGYALMTARRSDYWPERPKLWPTVMTEAEFMELVVRPLCRPVRPCPPDCPVCCANALVLEQMRQAEGQGWDC